MEDYTFVFQLSSIFIFNQFIFLKDPIHLFALHVVVCSYILFFFNMCQIHFVFSYHVREMSVIFINIKTLLYIMFCIIIYYLINSIYLFILKNAYLKIKYLPYKLLWSIQFICLFDFNIVLSYYSNYYFTNLMMILFKRGTYIITKQFEKYILSKFYYIFTHKKIYVYCLFLVTYVFLIEVNTFILIYIQKYHNKKSLMYLFKIKSVINVCKHKVISFSFIFFKEVSHLFINKFLIFFCSNMFLNLFINMFVNIRS